MVLEDRGEKDLDRGQRALFVRLAGPCADHLSVKREGLSCPAHYHPQDWCETLGQPSSESVGPRKQANPEQWPPFQTTIFFPDPGLPAQMANCQLVQGFSPGVQAGAQWRSA